MVDRFGLRRVVGLVGLMVMVGASGCVVTTAPTESDSRKAATPTVTPDQGDGTVPQAGDTPSDTLSARGDRLIDAAAGQYALDVVEKADRMVVLRRAKTASGDGASEILSVRSDGSSVARPLVRSNEAIVALAQGVDASDGSPVVYSTKQAVYAASMDAGEPRKLADVACGAIVHDASNAYCVTTSYPQKIVRISLGGDVAPSTLLTLDGALVSSITLDRAEHAIYYADTLSSTLHAVPTEGGSPRLVAEKVPSAMSLTTDANNVYAASFGSGGATLLQIDKREGYPLPLLRTEHEMRSLVRSGGYVYFADPGTYTTAGYLRYSGSVSKVAINTSSVAHDRQYVLSGLYAPHAFTIDDAERLYVSSGEDGSLTGYSPKDTYVAANANCRAKWHCNPCNDSCMLGHANSCVALGCAFEITVTSITDTECNVACVNPGGGVVAQ